MNLFYLNPFRKTALKKNSSSNLFTIAAISMILILIFLVINCGGKLFNKNYDNLSFYSY